MTQELITLPQEPISLTIEQDGMELQTFETLKLSFNSLFDKAEGWRKKALEMAPITSPDQKREMKLFRESRLALREIRIEVEKKRKSLKEDSLRRGKAIDGIANVFVALVDPIEKYLAEQEQFSERHEAQRIKELGVKRFDMLAEYGDASCFSNLGTMEDTAFSTLLDNLKLAKEARESAAKKIEQERIEREIAELAEQKRLAELQRQEAIRIEEERQKREAELKAAKEKAEKDLKAAQAKAKKEKDAAEAERKQREDSEAAAEIVRLERLRQLRLVDGMDLIDDDTRIESWLTVDFRGLIATARERKERNAADARLTQEKADREKKALEHKAQELREAAEKEREAREALELKMAQAAEVQKAFERKAAKEKAEQDAARKKAENAPNKEKLEAFGEALRAVKVPALTGDCEEVQLEIEGALQDLFILIKRVAVKL